MSEKRTFFISRTGADKRWAELIASVVRDAGYVAVHEDQNFSEGTSISHTILLAAESDCTIAVLSPAYFESEYCLAELHAALNSDPLGIHGRILPVLVAPIELPKLVGHLAYVDLLKTDDQTARKRVLVALRKHGKLNVSKLALRAITRRGGEQANRNRSMMIEKVRTIWISGFLQKSIIHETFVRLGLSELPDAVARPLDLLVRRPDRGERPLPSGTRVVEVFDSMDQSLLILGAPGSGKTTLLLELARDLLARADEDPTHPIPVVFPVSTWAETRKPLIEWLQDELNLRYDVPRAIALEWVSTDRILPLLDGLDEVKAERRAACVAAINMFRQSHGFLPLVITSRMADYAALSQPVRLHGAILVKPLSHEQVNTYLADLGQIAAPVQVALHEDSSLWELIDSPLMLFIIAVTYACQSETPLRTSGTVAERRDHLLASYVEQMLRRRATASSCTADRMIKWLGWLASQMEYHGKTVFYLEQMQPDWLPPWQDQFFRFCNRLIVHLLLGLLSGIVFGLIGHMILGLAGGLVFGLILGSMIGLFGGLLWLALFSDGIVCVERIRWSRPRFDESALLRIAAGSLIGVLTFGPIGLVVVGQRGFVAGAHWGGALRRSNHRAHRRIDRFVHWSDARHSAGRARVWAGGITCPGVDVQPDQNKSCSE